MAGSTDKGRGDGPSFKVWVLPSSFFSPQTLQHPVPFSSNSSGLVLETTPQKKHDAKANGSEGGVVELQQEKGPGQRQKRHLQEEPSTQSSQAQPNQYHLFCSGTLFHPPKLFRLSYGPKVNKTLAFNLHFSK